MATTPSNNTVRVVVRTKPTAMFAHNLISFEEGNKGINFNLPKNSDQLHGFINNQQNDWSFKVDKVLHNASQEEVYHQCGSGLISPLLDGYNATIMAFGQTGAGKTYTMTGPGTNYGLRGIIPRAVSQLFREIDDRQEYSINVRASYLEIYNDNIHDLLSTLQDVSSNTMPTSPPKDNLALSEDDHGNISVKGLTVKLVRNEEETLNLLFEGEMNRAVGEHSLNNYSSRSHCIFTLHIDSRSLTHSSSSFTVSKLTLVDLAGSERLNKTQPNGTLREAMYINKSLSFLEQVALALSKHNRTHIPYRQSKLTHLLKNSIGGNCSTTMIANIWVEAEQIEETISTLKFATRMMHVRNDRSKSIYENPELLLREYKEEIKTLRMELAIHDTLVGKSSTSYEPLCDAEVQEIDRQIKLYVEGTIPELEVNSYRQVSETFSRFKQFILAYEIPVSRSPGIPPGTADSGVNKRASTTASRKSIKSQPQKSAQVAPSVTSESDQDGMYVGDSVGTGFSMGVVPAEMKHSASPVAAIKKKGSPNITFKAKNKENQSKEEIKISLEADEGSSLPADSDLSLQTPPHKNTEFENFKKGSGQKIHSAFLNNKELLCKKNKECVELATGINDIKKEIDQVREYLKEYKAERESGILSNVKTDAGEIVLGEEEFSMLTEFKALKVQYRKKYQDLLAQQENLKILRQYVEKSRSKLLTEFNEWYKITYVGADERKDGLSSGDQRAESEVEKFERLQDNLLKQDPSTAAFYHAQLRTERRAYSRKDSSKNKPAVMTLT